MNPMSYDKNKLDEIDEMNRPLQLRTAMVQNGSQTIIYLESAFKAKLPSMVDMLRMRPSKENEGRKER